MCGGDTRGDPVAENAGGASFGVSGVSAAASDDTKTRGDPVVENARGTSLGVSGLCAAASDDTK